MLLGIAAIMMTACQKDEEATTPDQPYSITAIMPQVADTRLSYEEIGEDPKGLKVRWAINDIIAVGNKTCLPLTESKISEDGTVATLSFAVQPVGTNASFGKHDNTVKQMLSVNPLKNLSKYHAMVGTFNSETKTVKLEHTTSVMHIELSGLPSKIYPSYFTLSDNTTTYYKADAENLRATDAGTLNFYLVVDPQVLNGKTELVFSLTCYHPIGDPEFIDIKHTEYFSEGVKIDPGKVLHCNIKMSYTESEIQ